MEKKLPRNKRRKKEVAIVKEEERKVELRHMITPGSLSNSSQPSWPIAEIRPSAPS